MNKVKPTREQFDAFVAVQMSGLTNMFDIPSVIDYAQELEGVTLTRENILYIMSDYNKLKFEYAKDE